MSAPRKPLVLIIPAIVVAATMALSGCGKKSDLEPPNGKKDEFPRQYPDPSTL